MILGSGGANCNERRARALRHARYGAINDPPPPRPSRSQRHPLGEGWRHDYPPDEAELIDQAAEWVRWWGKMPSEARLMIARALRPALLQVHREEEARHARPAG